MTLIVDIHAIVRSFLSSSDPCAASNLGQLTENAIPNVAQARYLGQCNKLPSGDRSMHSKENSTTGESVVSRPSIPVPSSPTMKTLKLIRSDAIVAARLIMRAVTICDRVVVLSTGAYIVRLAHSGSCEVGFYILKNASCAEPSSLWRMHPCTPPPSHKQTKAQKLHKCRSVSVVE